MKQNKPLQKLAVTAVLVLLTAACTQGEAEPGTETDQLVPLTIEASLTGELVQPATRAVINTEGAKIGVFLTNQGRYTPQYDKKYTYTAGAWKAAAEPVCVDARAARVPAYYDPNSLNPFPANSFVTNPNALTAQLYADNKLWYYDDTHTSVNNTNPAIAFKMKPAYASIVLSVERDATYKATEGPCAIDKVTLATSGAQAYAQRAFDLNTGQPAGGSLATANPLTVNHPGIGISTTNTDIRLLMPPQDITTGGLTLSITVDGEKRSILIPASQFGTKLASGMQYTVYLKIVGMATLVMQAPVTIEDGGWASTPGSSSGSIEEVIQQ